MISFYDFISGILGSDGHKNPRTAHGKLRILGKIQINMCMDSVLWLPFSTKDSFALGCGHWQILMVTLIMNDERVLLR